MLSGGDTISSRPPPYLLISPLIIEQELLWDSGSLVPHFQPSLGPHHPIFLHTAWDEASLPGRMLQG